ncbi:MAG: serine dehydratase subunit alpha family protein [Halanaerobiales bacterium]|nr:serine dehydratase subunit alpha family protein [Halanaerobiales bacterium]
MISFKQFLYSEVKPALGCTEPGAVALAAARAAEELDETPSKIIVKLSENIFKNGMDVGIPGTNGHRGNAIAAALGVLVKDSSEGLEVLKKVNMEMVENAHKMVSEGQVEVQCLHGLKDIYIELMMKTANDQVKVIIEKNHSNISLVEKNGQIVYEGNFVKKSDPNAVSVFDAFRGKKLEEILALVDEMTEEDQKYLLLGAQMNRKMAEMGMERKDIGLRIGTTISELMEKKILQDDPIHHIRMITAAASDARMSGINMPVMSSAGSGNHGLVTILPIDFIGRKLNKEKKEIAKAIAISHLVTSYIKSHIGRLSPSCGCSVAAGSGATAGLVYLNDGDITQMKMAVKTVLSSLTGMLCDGAKESCALKVGVAASEAWLYAQMALVGTGITYAQGIIEEEAMDTACNLGKIDHEGMRDMDKVIISMLESRRCH